MKALKKLSLVLIMLCIVLLIAFSISYADNEIVTSEDDIMTISEDDITSTQTSTDTDKDLFLTDDSVTIDYSVNGNVFVLANDVTISSSIMGNVFICAKNVNIKSNAYINSSLFVLAENVTVSGDVYDMYCASSSLTLNSNARILRDISAVSDSMNLSCTITRNANLAFDSIKIGSNAKIYGDLSYSAKSADISEDIVAGSVSFTPEETKEAVKDTSIAKYVKNLLKVLVSSFIVILIMVFAMPNYSEKLQKVLENKTWPAFGFGLLALIVVPIACIMLFCTIIGILPSLAILFTYLFLMLQIDISFVSVPVSRILCKKMKKESKWMNVLMALVVVAVIWLVEQLPIVGGIASFVISVLALGIFVYALSHKTIAEKVKAQK